MTDYTLKTGDSAPDLARETWPEGRVNLAELRGQWVIVYFYPKDSTLGCTTESCAFRDAITSGAHAMVLGVSRDSLASHQRFTEKQALNFPLICDTDEALCLAFDVIQMKNMYGKQARGIERSTFIIDPEGIVRECWRKVRVKDHVEAVLEKLTALQG
ncbi:MAG: peroxiredoxin [Mariprofundaceae bacterium]|nr:peroxiredoxin [Mariprofundaceae bacterium]